MYILGNLSIVYALHKIPGKSKIKNNVSVVFVLVALGWLIRLILFFTQANRSLTANNYINLITLYTLIPLFALQNISIVIYVFDNYYQDNLKIKKRNIKLQNESVFTNFLNSLFHEINTPLSIAMTGITSMQKAEKDESKRQMQELIESSLDKIISLLNDRKLVYGIDEKINEAYSTKDLDKIIKRILDKNFTTRNVCIVTAYHSDVIKTSLRSIFSILMPLLEMFQIYRITNEILVTFISDNELEIELFNSNIFSFEAFTHLKLPENEDQFNTLNPELSEKIHFISNYISIENHSLEIIHEGNNEIYRIKI